MTNAGKTTTDIEMTTGTENSETGMSAEGPSSFPTRMDIFYDFNGSLGFAIGSSGFILEKYFENWLPYFRYGSILWIWGCIGYIIPLLLKLKSGSSNSDGGRRCGCTWALEDYGMFFCCLFYIIGCILGGFFDQEAVERFLPAINHTFVYGSFSLAVEPVYQAILFLTRGGSCRSRISASKLCGSPSAIADSENESDATLPPLKFSWDRFFELGAMIFFCAAGLFGGFPPVPALALPGVYFWEVGSLFSVSRSFVMVHERKQGLKAQALPK